MKASEITWGRDYMATGSNDYMAPYASNRRRVRVYEAPVAGWKRTWRYGYSRAQVGYVDENGRKDHALVREVRRDWDAERAQKFAQFDQQVHEGMDPDQRTALMDSIKVEPIWVEDGPKERIPLREIRTTWAEWDAHQRKVKEAGDRKAADAKSKKQRATILNEKLAEHGLELRHAYQQGWVIQAPEGKDGLSRDWTTLHAIETLLEKVST